MAKSISKSMLSLILAVVLCLSVFPFVNFTQLTAKAAIENPVSDSSLWDRVDKDGWYTSEDGGFKFYVRDWKYYGQYSLKIVESLTEWPINCACIAVYYPESGSVESPERFENKTAADMKAVLSQDIEVFKKTTVGNSGYTMYYARTANYENYVFQANGNKYFINFIWISGDRDAFAAFAAEVMSTIIIANDEKPIDTTQETVTSVSHEKVNGQIVFTVVTGNGEYNRVKASLNDNLSGYVGYSSNCTKDENGNLVWTIKVNAPTETTKYAFDIRSSATGKYLKNYYYYDVEIAQNLSPIKSVTHSFSGSKLVFKVVTKPGDFNRIKAALTTNPAGSLGVGTSYTVNADGNWVWTVKVPVPTETTKYVFDMRNTAGKYLKDYSDEYEVSMDGTIKYAKYTEYQGRLIFTVVTEAGDFNRLRCGLSTGTKDNLANASKYTVDENGNYVWIVKIQKPEANTTLYFDLRNGATNKYIKEFLVFDYEQEA